MLPKLFSENIKGILSQNIFDFKPLDSAGRSKAEVHYLYKVEKSCGSSAAIVRYSPGGETPAHRHPCYELVYILDGEVETDQGVFKKNDLIIMPPDSTHSSRSPKGCLALIIWNMPVEII